MMDDIPNLDFNFLDDELMSYPLIDELGLIESKEIENILNEIENPKHISTYKNSYGFSKPTIVIKNNKKSKNKIGTSLLAKPPKKLKKDKNSLLKSSSFSLNANNSNKLQDVVFQKHFTSYFYEDHNYCFNPYIHIEDKLDINNNENDYDLNSPLNEQLDEQTYKKANKNLINSLFNLTNINLFNNDTEIVHDVDEYFNQSFSNSIESESINSNVGSENEEDFLNNIIGENSSQDSYSNIDDKTVIELEENHETTLINTEIENSELNEQQIVVENKEIDLKNENLEQNDLSEKVINGFIDDINNYITDTDNELISLDEEDDDILIETDILIGEMFGDFGEYDLISKKAKTSKVNHKSKSNRNNKSSKPTANSNRRSRTISNSYSVRSSSSCSCCSEDLSEEEQQNKKSIEGGKKQVKPLNKSNRRSSSKLIKTDNTYIRKKNRFILKNSSF